MKKQLLLTFLAMLFSFTIAQGQNGIVINLIDNSSVSTAIRNIQKITFDANNLLLKTTSGNENSYPLGDVDSITFDVIDYAITAIAGVGGTINPSGVLFSTK